MSHAPRFLVLAALCATLLMLAVGLLGESPVAVADDEVLPPVGAPAPVRPPLRATPVQLADALPNAKPGECYAKVLDPAQLEPVKEKLVAAEATYKLEVTKPSYEWKEETRLAKEASHRLEVVAASFESVKETIELEPARRVWRLGKGKRSAPDGLVAGALALGVPATAKVGDCFSEFVAPAQFETRDQKVLVQQAAHRIEVTEPKYEWVEEKVVTRPATFRLEVIPATFETKTDKVLVSPATKSWKPGRGPTERIDNVTGDIMCLVETPAKYKTVSKRVVKTPAKTRKVEIPVEHKTIKVQKLASAPQQKSVDIPAKHQTVKKRVKLKDASVAWRPTGSTGPGKASGQQICLGEIAARKQTITKRVLKKDASVAKAPIAPEQQTVKVRKLATPAAERRVEIPAKHQTITRYKQVANERLAWRRVLCETNTTAELIREIQQALKRAGFDPGTPDGSLGPQTMAAVDAYQRKNDLARGGVTLATVQALGVQDVQ